MSSRGHGNGPLVVQRHEGRRRIGREMKGVNYSQLHDLSQRQQFDCRQNGLFLPMSTRRQIGSRRFSLGLGPNRNGDVSTARGLRKIAIFLILERPRIGGLPSVAVVMETKATNVSAAKFNYSVVAVPPAVFRWKCYWRENSTTEVNACRRCVVRF